MIKEARAYIKRAQEKYAAGDIAGGDADLDQARRLDPEYLIDYLEYAENLYFAEEYERAIFDFSKIIERTVDRDDLGTAITGAN